MVQTALGCEVDQRLEQFVTTVRTSGGTFATVESLTGGELAAAIAAAPSAGDWYRGGIVAYHPEVKFTLLGTPPGPVITPETAATMASSAARLLGAEYSVALTGVGGPGPDEGKPAGTVYIASVKSGHAPVVELHCFSGEPVDVMKQTICAALQALIERVEAHKPRG